ncbi:hypothetical protein [Agaribacterium haliotis]|uniref:hypothetical protein n=1 Tax=Agaribacterium haliotis TaxID=2013869 RepID=UPI001304637C|nr:hypothetical protein [Agaribacterium haliotis]
MEKKVLKHHVKGQKHVGKTDWRKVASTKDKPVVDEENPELIGSKQFKKVSKN